jgi:hypothetical protein
MGIEHQHKALIFARYGLGFLPLDIPGVKVIKKILSSLLMRPNKLK